MKPHEFPRIRKKSIRGDSGDPWPVWNRGNRGKILDSIFRNNFFVFNFSKMCSDESCRGEFPPTSPKGLVLVAQTDFCVYR